MYVPISRNLLIIVNSLLHGPKRTRPAIQYADILIASFPPCYEMRLCTITTNADETSNPINPARVVKFICDNYDKRMIGKEADKKSEDQAFAAQY